MNPMRRTSILLVLLVLCVLIAAASWAARRDTNVVRLTLGSSIARSEARDCGHCHSTEFSLWVSHSHSRALLDPKNDAAYIKGEFSSKGKGYKRFVEGVFTQADVVMAFGVTRTQVFWKKGEKGHELLPALWNMARKRWEPLPPFLNEVRKSRVLWEDACAGCHSSGFDPADDSYDAPAVSCRACHGDGEAHIASDGEDAIVRPSKLSASLKNDLCGVCHSRGIQVGGQHPFAVGYKPGMPLSEFFTTVKPVPGETTAEFWPDGTERKLNMQYLGFSASKHAEQELTCTTCHLPHGSDIKRGLKSNPEDLCTSCHKAKKIASPVHDNHPKGRAGCVDCHMSTVNPGMKPFGARTHTFKFLEPSNALKWKMPDSCTVSCHEGKHAKWAADLVEDWRR
jgi:predicted CXXCH cytochrome family protein